MERGSITLGVVKEVVEEHRALWERPREPLSDTAQRGLIGEMLVLQRLSEVVPTPILLSRWTGPAVAFTTSPTTIGRLKSRPTALNHHGQGFLTSPSWIMTSTSA